ncbi:uncharacterized protein F4807DRAFT_433404 [Annulohypoxylon truncatum]|uniref:uncharacterized protein n=1 Tax=Annulohypoxylon truncatum TaxID=327061 RepID=UPI0020082714|nr:uncharacterized protein F4807DRAFT_433404 [Annulohypoxylon truncatum]KAI1207809.1 hypothetical protein F4807DRAFT_433404 [Annulohypoxylon truncatum]
MFPRSGREKRDKETTKSRSKNVLGNMSSPAPYEGKLCCAICGDAILPPTPELSSAERWQTEAVLLSDPDREFEHLEEHYRGGKKRDAKRLDISTAREIRKDRARVIEKDRLRIIAANQDGDADMEQEEVDSNRSYGREENGEWVVTPYYIATHEACLEVAETVMRRSPHDIAVRDLRTLWKVLRMRFKVDDMYLMSSSIEFVASPQRIQLPHSYYMPFRFAPMLSGSFPSGEIDRKVERWEAAYPLHVSDLTSAVLENLSSLPPATAAIPQAVSFQKRFLALPPELRDHVCSFLASRNGMPGTCNGLLPQWIWREVLLRGECLPFLRDLDVAVVRDFCARWGREHGSQEPNWELLVRKLSQEAWSIWDAESSSLKVPSGLRNRRRIWQLIEEMYVGDLVPVKRMMRVSSDHVVVPRYWDERGEVMHPVVRVQVGSRDKLRSVMA